MKLLVHELGFLVDPIEGSFHGDETSSIPGSMRLVSKLVWSLAEKKQPEPSIK